MERKYYNYYRDHGICVICCRNPAVPGKTECAVCAERRNEKKRRTYKAYKDAGICVRCHKNPAMQGKTQCEACTKEESKKEMENYYFYKSIGICVSCHKYMAAPGKTRCEMCAAKEAEIGKKKFDSLSREEKKECNKKRWEREKKKEDACRSMGICVKCGRPLARTSSRVCLEHLLEERRKNERYRQANRGNRLTRKERKELPSYGICCKCCKNPVMEGKKVCGTCYEANLRALEAACSSSRMKELREYWSGQMRLDSMKASV